MAYKAKVWPCPHCKVTKENKKDLQKHEIETHWRLLLKRIAALKAVK